MSKGQAQRSDTRRQPLVIDATQRLRELCLDSAEGTLLGSLSAVAQSLGVGIVTVQQAARVLEHEGLLSVRRGPGGGYYVARPDDAALDRAFATYMRVHAIDYREAFGLAVMLDCEIIEAVASGLSPEDLEGIAALAADLETQVSAQDCIEFEIRFRETLLAVFQKPLLELLARVAMQMYREEHQTPFFGDAVAIDDWRAGRRRILQAILAQDPALASFEARRYRQMVDGWLRDTLPAQASGER
ncbi:FadR/GntR family transcriptional regulator [Mangrovimicrobium sediminis]|nr:FCD domain-containing protein [Haliea sp. SAOS-164]